MRRTALSLGLALSAFTLVHCANDADTTDGTTASQRSAVCAAEWQPTWEQGGGANEWWVEYRITGGDVASAYLELPSGGTVALTLGAGKWRGKPSAKIARGTSVILHATTASGLQAQTAPFSYLDIAKPASDSCATSCSADFRPSFHQGSGANEWWVEYSVTAGTTVASASLELAGGTSIPLTLGAGKWRGKPPARIPTGSPVKLHVATADGRTADSDSFAYLGVADPPLSPCGGDGTCSDDFAPTWSQGTGANEWWVEYAISGAITSARLDVAGGATVPLTLGAGKWRGKPSARIPSGTTVTLHAENSAHEDASTDPFAYLVEKAPKTTPCNPTTSPATAVDVGGTNTGPDLFGASDMFIDASSNKLLMVGGTTLRRCNLDGTNCTSRVLVAGNGSSAALIAGQKLDVASFDETGLGISSCGLDGANCVRHPIGGLGAFGGPPTMVVDAANQKLVIGMCTSTDASNEQNQSNIVRCNLDGTNCTVTRLRANESGGICQRTPAVVVDDTAQKLLFFAFDISSGERRLSLTSCNLQATNCSTTAFPTDIFSYEVAAVLDPVSRKLLVVQSSPGPAGGPMSLARCAADGTACTFQQLSVGGHPKAQMVGNELVLGVANNEGAGLSLVRCSPTNATCIQTDIPIQRTTGPRINGVAPVVYDPAADAFLVATSLLPDDGVGPYEVAPLLMHVPRNPGAITQTDVSVGPGENVFAGTNQSGKGAYLDQANAKILTLGSTRYLGLQASRRIQHGLTRCNLDGTACTTVETTTGDQILGVTGGHLYMLGVFRSDFRRQEDSVVELLRCNIDGTGCTRAEVQRFVTGASVPEPFAALDVNHNVAVVAVPSDQNPTTLVYRCPLDGAACSAPVEVSGIRPYAFTLDSAHDGLVFVDSFGQAIRCAADGTGCVRKAVSPETEQPLAIVADATGVTFLTVAAAYNCHSDLTACTRQPLPFGSTVNIQNLTAVIDGTELFIAPQDHSRLDRATAYRCHRDGSACVLIDLSANQPAGSATYPTILLDNVNHRVDVVASNQNNLGRATLFSAPR